MTTYHEVLPVCCQKADHPTTNEYQFQSITSFIYSHEKQVDEHFSETGKTSPLDFLATVAFQEPSMKGYTTLVTEGKERVSVVQGPSGTQARLHKGNGRLPSIDLTKPFSKKCRNRECNNLGGQLGKPRSIYCSKRCQSREQNLRQGRIKNVRSPTPTNGIPRRPTSPRGSPSPVSMMHGSSASPVPMGASPSPNIMGTTSPLTVGRIGMTPSPIPLTAMPSPGTFTPIPIAGTVPSNTHLQTPIVLPRPTQPNTTANTTAFKAATPKPPTPVLGAPAPTISSSSFQPSQQKKVPHSDSMENLTLAPILSST